MNRRKHNLINVLATGVVVVMLVCVSLFWARWSCSMQQAGLLPPSARQVTVTTADLSIEARMPRYGFDSIGLGALRYVDRRTVGGLFWRVYGDKLRLADPSSLYYNARLGLIVYIERKEWQEADETVTYRYYPHFAGPEGVGDGPYKELGRFQMPLMDRFTASSIVYDRALRQFFAIDWHGRTVRKGPKLANKDQHRPVQIRVLLRNPVSVRFASSRQETPRADEPMPPGGYYGIRDRGLVLDASGRIDLLDLQTLQYAGTAGQLVSPTPVFGSARATRPEDVVSYHVIPLSALGKGWVHNGCAVVTVGRAGLGMRLDVYDADGQLVGGDETRVVQYSEAADGRITRGSSIPSAQAAYFHLPAAQVLTLAKFTLENLHPPVLLLLSYLAAPHLEATAGYRSIFLLPDSFVAMSARDARAGLIGRPFRAFLFVLPALLLALLLAALVARDGVKVGLSKESRKIWLVGTIVFGLPAYITYRLTRPGIRMVTCSNCGHARRPDAEKCHRCGSLWVVPELTPPAWRVVEPPEPTDDEAPAPARETISDAE